MFVALLALTLAAPLGPGKAAGKGRADFDAKDLVAGEYTATLRVGFGDVQKTYQGSLTLANSTSSGDVMEVRVTGEGNETTTETVRTHRFDVDLINKTAISVKLDDKHLFELVFAVDQSNGSVEGHGTTPAGDKVVVSVVNGHYFTVQILGKDSALATYAISKKKVQQKPPVWQRLMSPAMMLVSMLVSQRMKKMQMANMPVNPAPQGVDYPIENVSDTAASAASGDEADAENADNGSGDAQETEEQDVE